MPQLNATISPGLWQALLDSAERTKEPLAHIVRKALAEYLQVSHHREGDYRIALPETEAFFKADLRRDPAADLAKAEGEQKGAHL
jgi:hypothetical protein